MQGVEEDLAFRAVNIHRFDTNDHIHINTFEFKVERKRQNIGAYLWILLAQRIVVTDGVVEVQPCPYRRILFDATK